MFWHVANFLNILWVNFCGLSKKRKKLCQRNCKNNKLFYKETNHHCINFSLPCMRTATPIVIQKVRSPHLSLSALYRKTGSWSILQTQSASGGERFGEWTFSKTMGFAVRSTSNIFFAWNSQEFPFSQGKYCKFIHFLSGIPP